MTEKYKGKYRIGSARLQNWDYGWNAAYYITICTDNRTHYFGEIIDGVIKLSSIGIIANILWYEIKNHAKNVELGEFIIMPNHIHGILILNNDFVAGSADTGNAVDPRHALGLPNAQPQKTIGQKRFQNQGKNTVSSIIGGYKSAVTKHARRLGFEFVWQSRFWDHIIRSKEDYDRIELYIINNPKKWENDKLNNGKGNKI